MPQIFGKEETQNQRNSSCGNSKAEISAWMQSLSIFARVEESQVQRELVGRFVNFARTHPLAFHRENVLGHITGSAWIVSADCTHVYLLFHTKLKKWLQPGGHADGEVRTHEVALREAKEETGLPDLHLISRVPFDLDVHSIPERKNEAAHEHWDVRYLICSAGSKESSLVPAQRNEESLDGKWVALKDVPLLTQEESVLRMVRKSEWAWKWKDLK
jgi:8-oxo-dGTP pyrophosphatase MutT (NUDIX family)